MDVHIKVISEQLYEDLLSVRERLLKDGYKKVDGFKKASLDFFKKCDADQTLGSKFLTKAYRKTTYSSGELFNLAILTNLLPKNLMDEKTNIEKITYGNKIIKDIFVQVMSDTVTLYSSSVLEKSNEEKIKAHIEDEVKDAFRKLKVQYGMNEQRQQPDHGVIYSPHIVEDYMGSAPPQEDKMTTLTSRVESIENTLNELKELLLRQKISEEESSESSEPNEYEDIMNL